MRIREANLSDVAAMARVMVDTFLAAHRGQIPEEVWKWRQKEWTYEVSAQGWERTLRDIANDTSSQECVYVAEGESGAIIGLAMGQLAATDAIGTRGEICTLYVLPDYQRQRAGRRLVEAIVAHLIQWGMTTLQIGVLKSNTPARQFYEALGGQVVGERDVEDAGFLLSEVVYGWSDMRILVSRDSSEQQ